MSLKSRRLRHGTLAGVFPALLLVAGAQTNVTVDVNGELVSPTNFFEANAATATQLRAGTESNRAVTPLILSTLIEARNGAGAAVGGKIFLNAGTGLTLLGVSASAGEIDLSGGDGDGSEGGSLYLFGGDGESAAGGSLLLGGGSGLRSRGGLVLSYGGTATDARGGDLLIYGTDAPGGDIVTFGGGGKIDTRLGVIQFGLPAARTTLNKTTSAAGNTLTLPEESGVLATRAWAGGRSLSLTGSTPAAALGALTTSGLASGSIVTLNVNGRLRTYQLRAETGADVPDGVTLVRPVDYNASTNKVIFSDITSDNGSIDVRVFGAKGDGTTDDRPAIQAAINHAVTVGKEVYLPAGTYFISPNPATSAGLSLPSGATIRGAGWSSILRFPGSGLAVCLANQASHGTQAEQDAGDTNIHVSDLKLDLEGTGNNGVVFGGVTGGSIVNVWVHRAFGYAIHLVRNNDTASVAGKSTEQILIRGCRVTSVRDVGIELSGANDCTVTNNYVDGTGGVGVLGAGYECWNGSRNNVFSGNVARGLGASNLFTAFRIDPVPLDVSSAVGDTENNVFVGNVANNVYIGFKCHSAAGARRIKKNTFTGNQIQSSGGAGTTGFAIVNADDMVITQNVLSNFSQPFDLSTTSQHSDQFSCRGAIIEGNTWLDSGGSLNLYGLVAGSFSGNRVVRSANGRAVSLYGARFSAIKGNSAWDLGSTQPSPFIVFASVGGVESDQNVVADNTIFDSRSDAARKGFYTVGLGDQSSGNLVRDNAAVNSPQQISVITNTASNLLAGNYPTAQAYTNGQIIHSSATASSSVGTGETTLRQVNLQDRALRKDGDVIEVTAALTFSSTFNSKRVKLYFGALTIYDSDPKPEYGTTLIIRARITRSGTSSQTVVTFIDGSANSVQPGAFITGNVNLQATTSIRITGQGVLFQDVVLRSLSVSYWSAP